MTARTSTTSPALTGLAPDEVVAAHTGSPWTVGFGGFAPGFAYLVGGDPRLEVPRRSEPRTSVPAGAVALAGPVQRRLPAILAGRLAAHRPHRHALWDLDRSLPRCCDPGARVRFVDLGGEA